MVNNKLALVLIMILLSGVSQSIKAQSQSQITFIENKGQWPDNVRFVAEIPGGMLFVEASTLTYTFSDPAKANSRAHDSHLVKETQLLDSIDHFAMKVNFIDANLNPVLIGDEIKPASHNYFYGSDRDKWVSGAKGFKKVIINDLYPGINLELTSEHNQIKYDLKLTPGSNPACIQMQYAGASELEINDEKLSIVIPYQTLREHIPASYALCEDKTRSLSTRYLLEGNVVSFEIGDIDTDETVVIDPLLVFSTYSGSAADNWGNTATYDEFGNGYAGGITRQDRPVGTYIGDFPATAGAFQTVSGGGWDIAILKFDSAGQNLIYATHLGGTGAEAPQSLIVNEAGELLILGVTGSSDFPVTESAYDTTFNGGTEASIINGVNLDEGGDLFIAKLSADGSELLASTYVGGTLNEGILSAQDLLARNYGDESRGDINFDSKGNILIASRTASEDFPIIGFDGIYNGGTADAVLLKLSKNLDSLVWSTYLGGNGADVALSVKVDSQDNIFAAGGTTSNNFPTTADVLHPSLNGDVDGWVAHISLSGDSLINSSYIGTTSYDQVFFLDLDANEDVYLAGQSNGDYPVTSGHYSSGSSGQFIHKLSNNLQNSIFSTVINSNGRSAPAISLTAFLVNDCDNIYLSGWGSPENNFVDSAPNNNFLLNTSGLPITQDAYQQSSDGSSFYLMVLSGDASELLYATHLGDANSLVHVDGGTSRFDKHGIVYHSVCASCFGDSSFPTTDDAYATNNGSSGCNNALFKFDLASLRARIQTNDVLLETPGLSGGCLPLDVVFENFSTGGEVYEWDFGDGTKRTAYSKDTIIHQYTNSGTFQVQLRAFDPNTCISEDYAYTSIRVSAPNFSVSNNADICAGNSIPLLATGGTQYLWSPAESLDDPTRANPIASPLDTTTYTVVIYNSNGCDYENTVKVNVVAQIEADIRIEQSGLCEGSREISIINESINATGIMWSFGDGDILEDWQPSHTYLQDGQYTVTGKLENEKCEIEVKIDIDIAKLNIPNVLTRNEDGINDALVITSSNPVNVTIFTRWGTKVYSQINYQNDWSGEGLVNGTYFYEVILENNEVCSGWIQLLDGG